MDPFKRMDVILRNTAVALQAWGQRKSGNIKTQIAIANYVILKFDRAMEMRALTPAELWLRKTIKLALLGLSSLQRTIERQRSRLRWIREGDANTKLFQAVANGRRSKISSLTLGTTRSSLLSKRGRVKSSPWRMSSCWAMQRPGRQILTSIFWVWRIMILASLITFSR